MKIVLIVILLSVHAFSGGWTGVGGGLSSYDQENIWFLGEEAIPYCIIRDKHAPSKTNLNLMIQRNSEKWKSFFARYELDQIILGASSFRRFPDKQPRKISMDFVEAQDCTKIEKFCNSETFDEEHCNDSLSQTVLFLVGRKNKVVEKFLEMNGPGIGAAIRTEYNHNNYRTGGIVWVENPIESSAWGWSQYSHILLHEMGHVLGLQHDSCWVMATKTASIIKNYMSSKFLEKIESGNWPFSFKAGDLIEFTDNNFKYTNKMIPNEGLKLLEFDAENSFRVKGEVVDKPSNLRMKINITFEEVETGKIKKLLGNLTANYEFFQDQGPSIYTWWIDEAGRKMLNRESISNKWSGKNFKGTVSFSDNKVNPLYIPVNFYKDKGLQLDIYFPNSSEWFSIVSQVWVAN